MKSTRMTLMPLRRLAAGLAVGGAGLLAGCATVQQPDPLEPINRKVFAFNEVVDTSVLKPAATVYRRVVPSPVRTAVGNFFHNVKDVWSATNLFLQGRPADGLQDMMRFGTNTVFGLFGLIDVATGLGLERHGEDFGQTLGRWGVSPGAYIVWPLLGPSTVRDSVGLPIEWRFSPNNWVDSVPTRNVLTVTRLVNTRADLLRATGMLDEIALDKYIFVRDAYLQRRRNQVYDGDPPPLDDLGADYSDDAAAADAPAASAAVPVPPAPAASAASGS